MILYINPKMSLAILKRFDLGWEKSIIGNPPIIMFFIGWFRLTFVRNK